MPASSRRPCTRPRRRGRDQRPIGREAHRPDGVLQHADHEGLVGVAGEPPARRPSVKAVDGRRQVGLESVQGELDDVGDVEQTRLGGGEVNGGLTQSIKKGTRLDFPCEKFKRALQALGLAAEAHRCHANSSGSTPSSEGIEKPRPVPLRVRVRAKAIASLRRVSTR